ncbi:MAG: SMC-Scp complex subunit ScpB [Candidatus Krumholzibacteriia bacterium]
MKQELEALLFATDSPLSLARLRKLFPEAQAGEIKAGLAELEAEYLAQERSFTVVEFGGGYQIATRPEFAPIVEQLFKGRRYARLSRAGLEVLAIVAYRQPITRLEIDEIRGVQSSGALATLSERNLVTVVGRSESVGHALLYGTTRDFLNHLGLAGLQQLPPLPDLATVMEDREGLRAFASQLGAEISDEEIDELRDPDPTAEPEDAAEEPEPAPDAAAIETTAGGQEPAETPADPTEDRAAAPDPEPERERDA